MIRLLTIYPRCRRELHRSPSASISLSMATSRDVTWLETAMHQPVAVHIDGQLSARCRGCTLPSLAVMTPLLITVGRNQSQPRAAVMVPSLVIERPDCRGC